MKDKIEFTIKNLNREKILKEIVKISEISDVKIEEENIKFSVNKNSQKKIEEILEKKGASVKNKRIFGFFNYLKNNIFKLHIIIPIFIFFIFFIISSNFIFKYEILGINLIKQAEVESVLNDFGFKNIKHKSSVNLNELEKELQKLDKVSLVSCIIKGNTLIINIKEKVYNLEYENKNEFKPLLATESGIITELEIIQGTPKVKIGQLVKKGDVLVLPYVIDTSGNNLPIMPMASIKADVFYNTITQVSENKICYKDANEIIEKREMYIGKNKIFDSGDKCNFKFYKTEISEEMVGNKNLLPIIYIKTKYIKQEQYFVENYFTSNQEKILEECKQKTRQLFADYEIIKDEYNVITNNAGVYQISYTMVVNKAIVN